MRLLIAVAALVLSGLNASAQTVVLGVLEDVPGVYDGESNYRAVRVVFRKDSDWSAYPRCCQNQQCLRTIVTKYPFHSQWTIGFDGRQMGQVSSHVPSEYRFYSEIGLQPVEDPSSVPTVGKRSTEFGGFSGGEVYRPLVANSRPYVSDPEGWKVSVVPDEIKATLRKGFRQQYPKLCKSSEADDSQLLPLPYRDNDVTVEKAYRSNTGLWIALLKLAGAIACNAAEDGFEIDAPWFVVNSDKSTKYLAEGMRLVDAGDYDNDGRSELLFSIDRYNLGGYVLFYDNFGKDVRFEFSYH